ncbi:MAG: HD domain-containing protein [Thermoplasmata archaeon]
MSEEKIVHDAVHGSISLKGVFLDIMESHEFQRLHDIKQLGLAYLVFPGAHHTRLEHSLGTYYVASRMCESLRLEESESEVIRCAALLHDVGHAPFSHTLEWFLRDCFGFTHEELTKKIILGKESMIPEEDKRHLEGGRSIAEVLEKHDIPPKEVAKLIGGSSFGHHPDQTFITRRRGPARKKYPSQMISGPIDCDQMDYLMRDSHYTGVAHGVIDMDRMLNTFAIFNGDLVVESRGVPAVEGMLVARALMYTTVYFHKTVRIAELMLAKAAENLSKEEISLARKQNDSGFLSVLRGHDEKSRAMVTALKYRRLYKTALLWKLSEMDDVGDELIARLCNYGEKVSMEDRICRRAGVPHGSVIIDVPGEEILTTEPRMGSVNIGVLEKNRVRRLSRVSPLASSLQLRKVQDWALMVACPQKLKEKVAKAADRVLRAR